MALPVPRTFRPCRSMTGSCGLPRPSSWDGADMKLMRGTIPFGANSLRSRKPPCVSVQYGLVPSHEEDTMRGSSALPDRGNFSGM